MATNMGGNAGHRVVRGHSLPSGVLLSPRKALRYFLPLDSRMASRSVPTSSSPSPHSTLFPVSPDDDPNIPWGAIDRRYFAPSSQTFVPSGSSAKRWAEGDPPAMPRTNRVVALGRCALTLRMMSASSLVFTTVIAVSFGR
jgi:hypothetical protein